jgi:hypothetical protein
VPKGQLNIRLISFATANCGPTKVAIPRATVSPTKGPKISLDLSLFFSRSVSVRLGIAVTVPCNVAQKFNKSQSIYNDVSFFFFDIQEVVEDNSDVFKSNDHLGSLGVYFRVANDQEI